MYKIVISKRAEKEIKKLGAVAEKKIREYISTIPLDNPRRIGEELKGDHSGLWSYHIDREYRLLCDIKDELLTVEAVKAGHRRNVYGGH
jgi:mRNA interferase RelE/StbE